MARYTPGITPQPQAPDSTASTALLQLALQLHHHRTTATLLDGRVLVLNDDSYLLMPHPVLEPGPLAVSVEFPDGVQISAVFDLLGSPFGDPRLEQAVLLVARAKEDLAVARIKAKGLIQDFVAEFAQAA